MDGKVVFKCASCGKLFQEPETSSYETGYGVFSFPPFDTVTVEKCPFCGSEDIDEARLCECGNAAVVGAVCKGCYEDIKSSFTRWIATIQNTYELSSDEIMDILEVIFNEL